MIAPETIAAHQLSLDENQLLVDITSHAPFDPSNYSLMKYGSRAATRTFAAELACQLAVELPEAMYGDAPPQFLVAYKAVPPACYFLSRYCVGKINEQRVERGCEPGRIVQVYKSRVAATNYAAASGAARERELAGIDFSLEGRSLRDVPAVVLDDIRITGAAERRMVHIVEPARPLTLTLGYIAAFNADQAAANPRIENDLNTTAVKDASAVSRLAEHDDLDLNIRTLKLLLAGEPATLRTFAEKAPLSIVEVMLRGTIDTGPDFVAQYKSGYGVLADVAAARGL